ncbi:MAG TPA: hypothetical protein VG248_14505 [Caulobacteraceae bacterium]|jgi:hypothetical protein|nr:hypothetical protein [Caulobacteraceae bacterium]
MKTALAAIAGLSLLAGASIACAQDTTTTIVHHDDGAEHSKTVVHHADGAKTVIKRHGNHVKKIHRSANGDKTVVKKTTKPE